ncbi:MAG: cytochrome C [Proteobacteria bacterium]|nr:MAG: cytochrome C [Pseudomonadota bacterium]
MRAEDAVLRGDPRRGAALVRAYGCGGCHAIPGVTGANGRVGPSLVGLAGRTTLAGRIPNTPSNLVRWIQHPQAVSPGTIMPEMGVADADARDLAAFLLTQR